ncbi:MAG: hypothetical protein J5527_02975 [Treponema sp.]|nr:hypothetical protein [Treponema sp.]
MDKTFTLEELAQLPDGTTIVCDSIPFVMNSFFFTYEFWEVQIIRNAIDFKKKYDKWPNFMTANPITYDNCIAEIDRVIEESMQRPCIEEAFDEKEKDFDWKIFDINKPIENYPLQSMPVKIDDGMFITPLFSMLWLDTKSYKEGAYKLSFGTNPGPDDGEEIDESEGAEPLQLRQAA